LSSTVDKSNSAASGLESNCEAQRVVGEKKMKTERERERGEERERGREREGEGGSVCE
jgi:hypothetical protein